jgi:hypothetical protein
MNRDKFISNFKIAKRFVKKTIKWYHEKRSDLKLWKLIVAPKINWIVSFWDYNIPLGTNRQYRIWIMNALILIFETHTLVKYKKCFWFYWIESDFKAIAKEPDQCKQARSVWKSLTSPYTCVYWFKENGKNWMYKLKIVARIFFPIFIKHGELNQYNLKSHF